MSGGLEVDSDSMLMARRHSLRSNARFSMCSDSTGNSQSRSRPSNPKDLATSIVDLMNAKRLSWQLVILGSIGEPVSPPIDSMTFVAGLWEWMVDVKLIIDCLSAWLMSNWNDVLSGTANALKI